MGEGPGQDTYLIQAVVLRKDRVEMAVSDIPRLVSKVTQGPQGLSDNPEACEEHQQESQGGDKQGDIAETVESAENLFLRTDDGRTPSSALEGFVKHVATLTPQLQHTGSLFPILHRMAQVIQFGIRLDHILRENGVVEQLIRIRVDKEDTTAADEDAVRSLIWLDW